MRFFRRILLPLGALLTGALLLFSTMLLAADNWSGAASELAAKILTLVNAQHAMALSLRNISSLSDDDVAQIRRALRAQLRSHGIRLSAARQAGVEVLVTISENAEGFLWVAEIRSGKSREVAMLTVAPPIPSALQPASEPVSIRRVRLFGRAQPVLDLVPLDNLPSGAAGRALVLGLDDVALYENQEDGSGWQLTQALRLPQFRPQLRDARGHLIIKPDNSLEIYVPGTKCEGTFKPALRLECQPSNYPWPLNTGGSTLAAAAFSAERNFFEGGIRSQDGHATKTPPFFSAGFLPLKNGAQWVLAGLDGRTRLIDAAGAVLANFVDWGSNVASIQSGCQNGWQVLASQTGDFGETDSVQAYNITNHKAEAASAPVEFAGPVTELWPLADGPGAIAISHNLKTSQYEAFRLSISCGQ